MATPSDLEFLIKDNIPMFYNKLFSAAPKAITMYSFVDDNSKYTIFKRICVHGNHHTTDENCLTESEYNSYVDKYFNRRITVFLVEDLTKSPTDKTYKLFIRLDANFSPLDLRKNYTERELVIYTSL